MIPTAGANASAVKIMIASAAQYHTGLYTASLYLSFI